MVHIIDQSEVMSKLPTYIRYRYIRHIVTKNDTKFHQKYQMINNSLDNQNPELFLYKPLLDNTKDKYLIIIQNTVITGKWFSDISNLYNLFL